LAVKTPLEGAKSDSAISAENRIRRGGDPRGALDEYALLKTMIDSWGDAFGDAFDRRERYRVRNFVSTALEARNATSHLSIPLQDHEALRYLDAIQEVLRVVKAPGPENRRGEATL
jgi:uncharacterized protein